ncbi:MAG: putative PEP-binding protein [Gammaproteobacteria bacterium]
MNRQREIAALAYVPGVARGVLSRDPRTPGAIALIESPDLPTSTRPAGIAIVDGAPFSHPALGILARGIPTVIVTAAQARSLRDGERIELDGLRGTLRRIDTEAPVAAAEPPLPPPGRPVLSADGVPVALRSSVRDAAGAARARIRGAEAIGLVRTEFVLSEQQSVPDAATYARAFGELLDAARPLGVTLRLLDIATDKRPAWLAGSGEPGRTLGRQGVRLFDDDQVRGVVEAQLVALDALARQGAHGRLRLLIPYVTSSAEAAFWYERVRARVDVPVGVMIETPAAALDIAALLEIADFAALGTNDLMQCLFAADRDQPALRGYLDPYAPLLHRFLAMVAEQAGANLPQLQVCGLLSQLPGVLPILLGIGYRAFSIDAAYLPYLADVVRSVRVADATALAAAVCRAKRSAEVRSLVGATAGWGG